MQTQTERAAIATPSIAARGLTKAFGGITAVDDLTFEVVPGRVTAFVGPNGAGKSTTLRMLLGLVTPDAGTASILGMPYPSLERPATTVGAVLDAESFHPLRTGRDHLRVLAAASGFGDDRVDEVLDDVGLAAAARRKVGKYSLGMRQRLGLASALLGDPVVLVLDEPANGLDPHGIRWLRTTLRSFARRGKTVLVSTHLLGEIAETADDVIVIDRGRLVAAGTIDDLTGSGSTFEDVFLELTDEGGIR
jgi:ABC-2 type transport system ATP-binding protein